MFPRRFSTGLLLLFLLTLGLYAVALGNGFSSIDDGMLIFQNNLIRSITPQTLATIFTSYDPELYIPLTFFSYQIDYLIGGYSPWVYHATSVLLHAGSAVLAAGCVFLLFRNTWVALFVGLLFAVHPINTEAVAWASARKDVLSGFFFLGALLGYLLYRKRGQLQVTSYKLQVSSRFVYFASLFCFLLALLSKVTAVTLPLVLLLIGWYERRRVRDLLRDTLPYFGLSIIFGIVALGGKTMLLGQTSLWEKILLSCRMTVFGVWKILVPLNLSVFYPETEAISLLRLPYIFSVLCLIAVAALLVYVHRKRALIVAILFFLITLTPAFLTPIKGGNVFFFSDRYVYIPAIGIFLMLGMLVVRLPKRIPITVVTAVILSILTLQQIAFWGNSTALFARVTRLYPKFYLGHISEGSLLHRAGKSDEAIAAYRRATGLYTLPNTFGLIGQVEAERGNTAEAIAAFNEGLALLPDDRELHYGLGQVYALSGNRVEALREYEMALALAPEEEAGAYRHFSRRISSRRDMILLRIGILYGEGGDHARAIEYYRQAVEENPFNADAEFNLAVGLGELGQYQEAIAHYQRALELDPAMEAARHNLEILNAR